MLAVEMGACRSLVINAVEEGHDDCGRKAHGYGDEEKDRAEPSECRPHRGFIAARKAAASASARREGEARRRPVLDMLFEIDVKNDPRSGAGAGNLIGPDDRAET